MVNAVDTTWVIVRMSTQLYGLDAREVREMVQLPPIVPIPARPPWIRGAARIRNDIVMVGDMRLLLGLETARDESEKLVQLLSDREQDHIDWVRALETSVRDGAEFKLTTDPHACRFGKWYDSFHTDNLLLAHSLKRFDEPHRAIHALGVEVIELMKRGARDEAIERIENERARVLKKLLEIFAETRDLVRSAIREILITLRAGPPRVGLSVDAIHRVGSIDEHAIEPIPGDKTAHGAVTHVARNGDDGDVIMLLDASFLHERLGVAEDVAAGS